MRRSVVPAVALVLLAACTAGGVGRPVGPVAVVAPPPRPTPPADAVTLRVLTAQRPLLAVPHEPTVAVHARPGVSRPSMELRSTNPWGQRLRLLVLDHRFGDDGAIWLRVQLPVWPNGRTGWIRAWGVSLRTTSQRVVVDLSDRELVRFRAARPVARVAVGVGTTATPTPPGRYVVWARVPTGRPFGPYGSFILGLSGFSEAIDPAAWPGEPRLAIHGTDDPADAGRAVSNGCVRVFNALLRHLRDLPMGTPVVIRP